MAKPQIEDGRSEIANELLEAIIKTHLTPRESAIFWTVVRKTYGWHKKSDRVSYSQFEAMTGMSQRHIGPTLHRLIDRQIISRFGEGHSLEYAVQKDYELWQTLPKMVAANTTDIGSEDTTDIGSDTLPKTVVAEKPQTLPKTVSNTTENGIKTLPISVDTKALTKALDKSNINYLVILPDWVDKTVWAAYLKMRIRLRKPATEEACVLLIKTLTRLRDTGNDPTAVMNQSIERSWQGLFEIKENGGTNGGITGRNQGANVVGTRFSTAVPTHYTDPDELRRLPVIHGADS